MKLLDPSNRRRDEKDRSFPPSPVDTVPATDHARPIDTPETFDDWLDQRLRILYRSVLQEPLPPEILELLGASRHPK